MKKLIISLSILFLGVSQVYAGFGDGYSAPCSKAPNGKKYCNSIGGYYFYDEQSNKFWMPMNAINSNGIIISRTFANYIPQTKTINWKANSTGIEYIFLMKTSGAVGGQNNFISVNSTPKTPEQYKAELQKKEAALKKAQAAKEAALKKAQEEKEAAEKKKAQEAKIALQKNLEQLKSEGKLPTCKKLYWKYTINPLYLYSIQTPEPFKDIEGTEKTYCTLKDGTATMLQFEDKQSSEGATYRGPMLMDFTGKTKYYPWD